MNPAVIRHFFHYGGRKIRLQRGLVIEVIGYIHSDICRNVAVEIFFGYLSYEVKLILIRKAGNKLITECVVCINFDIEIHFITEILHEFFVYTF